MLNGMGLAEAEASALAAEVAANITEIRVCTDCNETAAAVSGNFSELFVPAVANATVSLMLATTEENQVIAVEEFVTSVSEIIVVNFTRVLLHCRSPATPATPSWLSVPIVSGLMSCSYIVLQ